MRILLIQPPKSPRTIGGEDVFIYEPLALEYLASGVRDHHDVRILDMRLEKDVARVLAEFQPDIVGITAYTVHVNVAQNLFDQVKAWNPATCTVVGGHHATVSPADFLIPSIDVIVTGEGVLPFREIVTRFEKKATFEGIPGTVFTKDGTVIAAQRERQMDLDALPFPDRTLTAQYRGEYFSEWMKPLASIRTSKGCPFRCKFCAEWKVAGGQYARRQPERIAAELAEIPEECVFFADDESLVDTARMSTLARLISGSGIRKRYFLYGRSDTIARNPKLLETWRGIGLERVFVGLEFLTDDDMVSIRKSSTTADNERALHILRELGIDVYGSFIVRPDALARDFARYRDYCRRMKVRSASFAVLTPLPGTDLYEEVRDRLLTHDHEFFDFLHTVLPTTLPLKEFYSEFRKLYMRAVPLRRQLSLLRKYPLREIPGILAKGFRFYDRLQTAHLDYAA